MGKGFHLYRQFFHLFFLKENILGSKERNETYPEVFDSRVTPEVMTQIEIINGCQSYAKMYGSCKASEKHYIPIEGLQANQKLFYIVSY